MAPPRMTEGEYFAGLRRIYAEGGAGAVLRRRLEAIEEYGITFDIEKAGFLFDDGTLLDFSKGSHTRTQDHRWISHLLTVAEQVPDGYFGERTTNMRGWMFLTRACRVGIYEDNAYIEFPVGHDIPDNPAILIYARHLRGRHLEVALGDDLICDDNLAAAIQKLRRAFDQRK